MKTILMSSLLLAGLAASAVASPVVATAAEVRESDLQVSGQEEMRAFAALNAARAHVAAMRARWDAAVQDGHPRAAGTWARRHFEAMQVRKAALARWQAAVSRSGSLVSERRGGAAGDAGTRD